MLDGWNIVEKESRIYKLKKNVLPIIWLIAIISIALGIVLVSAKMNLILTLGITLAIAGLSFVLICIVNPKAGYFLIFLLPFVGFELHRFLKTEVPVGLAIQIMFLFLLIILLIKRRFQVNRNFKYFSNPINYIIIITQLYLVIQAFNPEMHSIDGWLFILRGALAIMVVYFVTLIVYDEPNFVETFMISWMVLSTLSAVYACYQEWVKIPSYVLSWIHATEERYHLIYVAGHYRKFSVLSDPSAFGNFMAISSLASIILLFKPSSAIRKLALLFSSTFLLLAMGYSGTRTSVAMFVAGLILYILMTINNRRTLLFAVAASLTFAFLIFGPIYGNATIHRIRSTFNSEDKSLNVRDTNRKSIQDYIYEHPIGGGVMTTGDAGMKYNPNHRLAGFPPDSGLLKTALELGWIGLIIELLLYVIAMSSAIRNFYHTKNINNKYYYLVICIMMFSVAVGSYAQSIQTQIPLMTVFFPCLALITRLQESDMLVIEDPIK